MENQRRSRWSRILVPGVPGGILQTRIWAKRLVLPFEQGGTLHPTTPRMPSWCGTVRHDEGVKYKYKYGGVGDLVVVPRSTVQHSA